MTGALNFKNGTWNLMGDDAYIGDCNVAGMIGVKGANAATPGFVLYNNSETLLGKLYASGGTLNWSGGTIAATTFSGNASTASLLALNTNPTSTVATAVGTWSPVSDKVYVYRQRWTNSAVGSDTADLVVYLDGNLTANMCLDGYYFSLLGFKKSGSSDSYVLLGGGGHKALSNFATSGHNHDGRYLRYFRYTTSPNADSMEDGWHDAKAAITNAPTTNHGTLIQNSYNGTPFQIFIPDASYYIYKRYKSGSIGGTWTKISAGYADSADKLTSSAGSATLPIYFSDGKPVACTASSVFSNLSNSGNNISVTVAGQNRTLTVGYASAAGNADTVDGYHADSFLIDRSGNYTGLLYDLPCKSIFSGINLSDAPTTGWVSGIVLGSNWNSNHYQHYLVEANSRWYATRVYSNGKMVNWNTFAYLTDNVASATKLQTPRTIWGQSFDGTANIDNTLRIRQTTGNYCEGIRIQTADSTWATIILGATADTGTNANAWSIHRKADNNFAISRNSSDGVNGLVMTSTGMGLGTTAPTQRLDVNGNIWCRGALKVGSSASNNYIAFYGNTGDNPGSFVTSFIGEHLWGGNESTELLLMKFNDVGNGSSGTTAYSSGPDRIRHLAHAHVFQIMTDTSQGDFATMASSTAVETKFDISRNQTTSYNNITISNGTPTLYLYETGAGGQAYLRAYGVGASYNTDLVLHSTGSTIVGAGESAQNMYDNNVDSLRGSENLYLTADGSVKIFANCDSIGNRKHIATFDTNGYAFFSSYINIGGHEKNASSPTYVWGSNSSDNYLRSYQTSSLSVNYANSAGNADTVDGYHASWFKQTWTAIIQGNAWSRLYQGTQSTLHHVSLFSVEGSIGCVVFSGTFLVQSNHPTNAQIICLANGNYTQPKMRVLVNSSGDVLVDMYWIGNDCNTSSSSQQMSVVVHAIPLKGNINQCTSFINDSTIPSGYSNAHSYSLESNTSVFRRLKCTDNVYAPNFYSTSDISKKTNIQNISKSIRSFNWKDTGLKSYGLIAQEIEDEYPELVSNNDNGYKSINYTSALCMIIAKLENGLDKLKEKVKQLEDKLRKYENTL